MEAKNGKLKTKLNSEASEETEAIVENNIPNASEIIKQKTIKIMDAIRKIQQQE